jgi:hypothetical protein
VAYYFPPVPVFVVVGSVFVVVVGSVFVFVVVGSVSFLGSTLAKNACSLLYNNPTVAISAALNAPLVDAISSVVERFFKSPIDKALGSGWGV